MHLEKKRDGSGGILGFTEVKCTWFPKDSISEPVVVKRNHVTLC